MPLPQNMECFKDKVSFYSSYCTVCGSANRLNWKNKLEVRHWQPQRQLGQANELV